MCSACVIKVKIALPSVLQNPVQSLLRCQDSITAVRLQEVGPQRGKKGKQEHPSIRKALFSLVHS